MIRVCFGNSQMSPKDEAQLGRPVVQISKTTHPMAKPLTPMRLRSSEKQLPDDSSVFRK